MKTTTLKGQKDISNYWQKHTVSTILLILYYMFVLLITWGLLHNTDNYCGTGEGQLILFWGVIAFLITIVLMLVMALKEGYSWKEYLIVLGLIFIPLLIAIKWGFF